MQYHTVTLACPELPLPCKDPITGQLGAVRHFQIKTRLSAAQAIGHLHRNYPPFSITHTFLKMLKYASETVENPGAAPLIALIGEKGAGKTSSAELVAYLVDGTGPEVFNCGDRSLDDLLFEPILADTSHSLVETLQQKFNSGEINPINANLLKTEIPEAIITDESGKQTLDLSRIGPENVRSGVEAIKTVVHLEGIGNQNGIGISYQEGPLIRVWKAAQAAEKAAKTGEIPPTTRLIIDEIDKRMPNTGKSMQQVWLVLQGLSPTHTVSKNGIEFTFSRKTMPKGFSVVLTGNDDRDLAESAGFSQSQASRMTILSIDKTTHEDLTHRICQSLCGMSLLSLDLLPHNAKEKSRILQSLRTLGEDVPLTDEETWLLKNHEKTLLAARQLASFYLSWEKLIDPENPGIDDPILEATAAFREPPGVRMAQTHIRRAKGNDILDVDFDGATLSSNPLESLLSQTEKNPDALKGLGERIEKVVLEAIQLSAGGPETKAKILEIAKLEGLIPDPDEETNPNPNRKTIRDLLATESESFVIQEETKILQKHLYKNFLITHKDTLGGKNPDIDTLLPLRDLQAALNQLNEQREIKTSEQTTYILNINPHYLTGNKTERPVECIPVLSTNNSTHYAKLKEMGKEKIHGAMLESKTLLSLLQTPKIGQDTLDGLWNEGWKKEIGKSLEEDGIKEEGEENPLCVRIIEGSCPDLRVAKIMTMGEDGTPEPFLIINSPSNKKTWVISETQPSQIIEATLPSGEKTGHVLEIVPKTGIQKVIDELKGKIPAETMENLPSALFAYLSSTDGEKQELPVVETIEIALSNRKLNHTKLPLRIDPTTIGEMA